MQSVESLTQETAPTQTTLENHNATPPLTKLDAVRLAKEALGETSSQALAEYVQATFGVTVKPAIVTVLLGTLKERKCLEESKVLALAAIEKYREENPDEKVPKKAKKRTRKSKEVLSESSTINPLPDSDPRTMAG